MTKHEEVTDSLTDVLEQMIKFRAGLEEAMSQSSEGHTFDDAIRLVASGQCYCVYNSTSCAILEPKKFPAGMAVHILWATGDTEALVNLYNSIETMCKNMGVKRFTSVMRKGFYKKLPQHGWKFKAYWVEKEL